MKKILIAAMALACTAAFAGEGSQGTPGAFTAQKQKQSTEVTSVSTSQAAATNQGNAQTIAPGAITTNNFASDLKDQGATAAAIGAAAAIEIAKIQAGSTGDRDLSADQRAALDREAAKDIAKLGQTIKNTPSMATAALVSSNDTCMGSVSAGGSGPGFGVSLGTTYKDENCVMLKNSRELWNMGMKAASMALMCTDRANREALELTGFECPQTTAAKKAESAKVASVATVQPEVTDPIVRARLGLDTPVAAK